MPSTCCSVPLCKNRGGHLFPTAKTIRKRWLHAIRRDKWLPSKTSVVCRSHFQSDDYVSVTVHGKICDFITYLYLQIKEILYQNQVVPIKPIRATSCEGLGSGGDKKSTDMVKATALGLDNDAKDLEKSRFVIQPHGSKCQIPLLLLNVFCLVPCCHCYK